MAMQKMMTRALVEIDGKEKEFQKVVILPIDQMVFEKVGRQRGWNAQESPLTLVFFCTYNALKRAGEFNGSFDEFMASAQSVLEYDEDDTEDEDAPGNPTRKDR